MKVIWKAYFVLWLFLSGVGVGAVPNTHLKMKTNAEYAGEAIIQKCLQNNKEACYEYAFYAAKELNNFATYRLALKRACLLEHQDACQQLEKDDKEGEEYRKKCDSGDVDSCVIYSTGRAQMYEDAAGAKEYATKACQLGHEKSCRQIKADLEKITNQNERGDHEN